MAGLDPAIHAFSPKKALLFLKKKKQKDFFMLGLGWWHIGCHAPPMGQKNESCYGYRSSAGAT
jgi:hypothetical protein